MGLTRKEQQRRKNISIAQAERNARIRREFPQPVEGKRKCAKCNKWKYYNIHNTKISEFGVIKKKLVNKDVSINPRSECYECTNKRHVAYRERLRQAGKLQEYDRNGRKRRNMEKQRKYDREYRRRKAKEKKNPESLYDIYAKAFPEGLYD